MAGVVLICVCVLTFPHGWCRVDLCTQLLLLEPLCLIVAQNESATAQLLDNPTDPTHKFHVREACASGAERKREREGGSCHFERRHLLPG